MYGCPEVETELMPAEANREREVGSRSWRPETTRERRGGGAGAEDAWSKEDEGIQWHEGDRAGTSAPCEGFRVTCVPAAASVRSGDEHDDEDEENRDYDVIR